MGNLTGVTSGLTSLSFSGSAVAILSDVQLAKVTPDYSTEVAEARVIEYANKIVNLTNLQRHAHTVKKCAVLVAGDIVEGELIFPGQSHLIDASLYNQVTVDGPRILTKFFDIRRWVKRQDGRYFLFSGPDPFS